jgi:hypothetical protein
MEDTIAIDLTGLGSEGVDFYPYGLFYNAASI